MNKIKVERILILLGGVLILLKGLLPEYIDEEGILHEPFFLLPIGFGLIGIGLIIYVIKLIQKKKN